MILKYLKTDICIFRNIRFRAWTNSKMWKKFKKRFFNVNDYINIIQVQSKFRKQTLLFNPHTIHVLLLFHNAGKHIHCTRDWDIGCQGLSRATNICMQTLMLVKESCFFILIQFQSYAKHKNKQLSLTKLWKRLIAGWFLAN